MGMVVNKNDLPDELMGFRACAYKENSGFAGHRLR